MSAEITTWLVPLVAMLAAGLLAGFAAGIFGIGGGFVVVPALLVVLPLLGGTKDAIAHVAIEPVAGNSPVRFGNLIGIPDTANKPIQVAIVIIVCNGSPHAILI